MDDILITRMLIFMFCLSAAAATVFGIYASHAVRAMNRLQEENIVLRAKIAAWIQWAEDQNKDQSEGG